MNQVQRKKWNIIDIIALLLVVAIVAFAGYKLVLEPDNASGGGETVTVRYSVKAVGVEQELYDNIQEYLPSPLMASGELHDGNILSVRQEPHLVLSGDGMWVESPTLCDLYFEVEATIAAADAVKTEIANQEVRIGRNDHILKSLHIEIPKTIIVDVTWGE